MIYPSKYKWVKKLIYRVESRLIFPLKFNNIKLNGVEVKDNHSVLLLQNHLSWWDGFWATLLSYKYLKKDFFVMVQEDQLAKNLFLRYKGCFSVRKNSREAFRSIDYAADLLNNPANLVLIFPQGRLQSMHTREIFVEAGVARLMKKTEGKCQVIYNAVVIEFLESFKPTVTFNLLDCGTTDELTHELLKEKINEFHNKVLENAVRK